MVMIVEAKNRAYEQVQGIIAIAINKPDKFVEIVNKRVLNVSCKQYE